MRACVHGHELVELTAWEAARAAPDLVAAPDQLDRLEWHAARVPGTAASTLAGLGAWEPGDDHDFDSEDWWFRTTFEAGAPAPGEETALRIEGLATVAHVYLNGEPLLESESMFQRHELDVTARLQAQNELTIRFRALDPLLREPRRPRARWRTRVVSEGNLRFFRTTMLGRAPGFAPRPAPVGPWRPVRLVRRRQLAVESLKLVPRLVGDDGHLEVAARLRPLGNGELTGVTLVLSGSRGSHSHALSVEADASGELNARGTLVVPAVPRWWPHTHGEPELLDVTLIAELGGAELEIDGGRVGFRELTAGPDPDHDFEAYGLDLHVNGARVFCRGAVWTPVDPVGLSPAPSELRRALETARDGGINLLRLAGTGMYESKSFYDQCDELGLLVWQDLMFANLDYPFGDEDFCRAIEREAEQLFGDLGGRPSVTVVCGNSEIEQQVGMLGLDPALGRGEMFAATLPETARAAGLDAIYVPSAPCGGELPFRPDKGIANYFGVGAYLRPVEDARRASVRFASECLAFSNVPDESGVDAVMPDMPGSVAIHHPGWKRGVPRDVGAGWDFEDVRDHYLEQLFGVDARELRSVDQARYLELSRAITGELMAEVFGEWRRGASPCGGGVVLWWHDLMPGAGWGLVDHRGRPKVAYYHLRRALAPVAVWTTDEGLGGVAIHAANDRPSPLRAQLRVALYRDCELRTAEACESIELAAQACSEWSVEGLLGYFVDASWAYRFGPPEHDAIVVRLESHEDPATLLSQAVRFPAGRPLRRETQARMGIEAAVRPLVGDRREVAIRSERLAYGVRLHAPAFFAEDQGFTVEPGRERLVELRPSLEQVQTETAISLTALNLDGALKVSEAQ